jgi:hypothetical protein
VGDAGGLSELYELRQSTLNFSTFAFLPSLSSNFASLVLLACCSANFYFAD